VGEARFFGGALAKFALVCGALASVGCGGLFVDAVGLNVDVVWNENAAQFVPREDLSCDEEADVDLGPASLLSNPVSQAVMLGREGSGEMAWDSWLFRKMKVGEGRNGVYSVLVRSKDSFSRFRVGLTASNKIKPGHELYREWMLDNSGSWLAAGIPEHNSELDGDQLWGSFGLDGAIKTSRVVMHVDLPKRMVAYELEDKRLLRFSLDGFAKFQVPADRGDLKEITSHQVVSSVLTIGSVSFPFETANFGPRLPVGKTLISKLVLSEPLNGCTPFTEAVGKRMKGSIVFALRGDCDFLEKVLNAQAWGASAVIVGDNSNRARKGKSNKNKGKRQGVDVDLEDGLVIMDQFNRPEDALKVKTPSVFVSFQAYKHILELQRSKLPIDISLRDSVFAPGHHGIHWLDVGLSPSLWLGPNAKVEVSLLDTVFDDSDLVLCRPLVYVPFAKLERTSFQHLHILQPGASSSTRFSKRLVANGEVCNEPGPQPFRWLSYKEQPAKILPWSGPGSGKANELDTDFEVGWALTQVNGLAFSVTGRFKGSTLIKDCDVGSRISFIGSHQTYHVEVNETKTTAQYRQCVFTFSLVMPGSILRVDRGGLLNSAYRAKMRYFWKVSLKKNHHLAAFGVLGSPMLGSEFWGITSDRGVYIRGSRVSVGSSSVGIMSTLYWKDYIGVLLDLVDNSLVVFTDPGHSRWIRFDLEPKQQDLRTLGDFVKPNKPDEASKLVVGYTPLVMLENGGYVQVSSLFSRERAEAVYNEMMEARGEVSCTHIRHDLTSCSDAS